MARERPRASTSSARSQGRTYAGESQVARDAARRARLVEAALELYANKGYAATTVDALCAEARISLRSFYEIVRDREALLIVLYEHIIAQMIPKMADAMRAVPPNVRAICHAGVRASVDAFVADERMARIVFIEMLGVSAKTEHYRMAGRARIADAMAVAARRVFDPDELSDQVLRWRLIGMIGAFEAVLIQWLGEDERSNQALLVETLAEGVAGFLGSDSGS